MVKYLAFFIYRHSIKENFDLLKSVYIQNTKSDSHRRQIIEKCINRFNLIFKIGKIIFYLVLIFNISIPLFNFIIFHHKYFALDIFLPVIDPYTNFGFICNCIVQLVQIFIDLIISFMADMIFIFFICHAFMLSQLFLLAMKDLNAILKYNMNRKQIYEFKMNLRNCLLMHQELTRFIKTLNKIYFIIVFYQISSSIVLILIILLLIIIKVSLISIIKIIKLNLHPHHRTYLMKNPFFSNFRTTIMHFISIYSFILHD